MACLIWYLITAVNYKHSTPSGVANNNLRTNPCLWNFLVIDDPHSFAKGTSMTAPSNGITTFECRGPFVPLELVRHTRATESSQLRANKDGDFFTPSTYFLVFTLEYFHGQGRALNVARSPHASIPSIKPSRGRKWTQRGEASTYPLVTTSALFRRLQYHTRD